MKRLNNYLHRLPNPKIVRNIGVLAGGTAFAQIVSLLALPILTRIYTPQDFSVLAVYISLLTTISPIACWRLDIAIPISKDEEEANKLLLLSVICVVITSILTTILSAVFSEQIAQMTNRKLSGYLWLIPLGVFFSGIYSALKYWTSRQKKFKLIAKTQVSKVASGNSFQILLGVLGAGSLGLLIGQLINTMAGITSLARSIPKHNYAFFKSISKYELQKVFIKYKRFPKFSIIETFANSGAIQIPIILIAYYTVGPEAGFLMLAMKILAAPVGLIGSAIAQVYLVEAAEQYHTGNLKKFTTTTILNLTRIGLPIIILIGLLSPFVIPIIFGKEWTPTSEIILWILPWIMMQMISSPVSMTLHITGNQKIAMFLQLFGLILRAGSVFLGGIYFASYIVQIYAITGFIFYTIYLFIILYIVSKQ